MFMVGAVCVGVSNLGPHPQLTTRRVYKCVLCFSAPQGRERDLAESLGGPLGRLFLSFPYTESMSFVHFQFFLKAIRCLLSLPTKLGELHIWWKSQYCLSGVGNVG